MRIAVGITGASGSIYAQRLVEALSADARVETVWVVVTAAGRTVFDFERGAEAFDAMIKQDKVEAVDLNDFFCPVASGSNAADVVAVVPCSMGTLGRVAAGVSGNLLERAADVQLKEGKKLILGVRETPLSLIHLRNMTALKEAGAVVLPLCPSFYAAPQTVDELVAGVVERILAQMGLGGEKSFRWAEK